MSFVIETTLKYPITIPDAGEDSSGVVTLAQVKAAAGGGGWNVVDLQVGSDTYDASPNDFVPCDATGGNVGVVLPDATTCKGQSVAVKDAAGGNSSPGIKITTVDGQTIDGESSLTMSAISGGNDFSSVEIVSDGANWLVGAAYGGHS